MTAPTTGEYEDLRLEVEFTPASGTYAIPCGIMGLTFSRSATVDRTEVPADCTDESLPYSVGKSVRSLDFGVEGDATWAQQSHKSLMDWLYSGQPLNVRVFHAAALSGDTEYETGPALLTQLDVTRQKGSQLAGKIKIEFVGTPTRTAKA